MGKTISKGKTFGVTETVTNTKLHTLVDDATITKVTDADNDTKIDLEESSDEDIIRFDTAGTERVTISSVGIDMVTQGNRIDFDTDNDTSLRSTADDDLTVEVAAADQVKFTDGTIEPITDDDVDLGTSSKEFKDLHIDGTANIDSLVADTADINAGTVDATIGGTTPAAGTFTNIVGTGTLTLNDDSDAVVAFIDNGGTNHGLEIDQIGVNASDKYGLKVRSNTIQTTSDALIFFQQANGSSNAATLKISQGGSGVQITGQSNENLSNAGVWTDRTSLFADKENLTPLVTTDLAEKLKGMKLYRYQKKSEIYGNKKDDKYSSTKIRPDAKEYVGLILDEPTTPEELISRDLDGNINGKSGTQIAEFLLGVCQGLIKRIEVLENA